MQKKFNHNKEGAFYEEDILYDCALLISILDRNGVWRNTRQRYINAAPHQWWNVKRVVGWRAIYGRHCRPICLYGINVRQLHINRKRSSNVLYK
jgi:hypothetical protein